LRRGHAQHEHTEAPIDLGQDETSILRFAARARCPAPEGSEAMSGNFFAIGTDEFSRACALGLNPAIAFLVLARGSAADNITTRWSADAVSRSLGIAWKRASVAIAALEEAGLAKTVKKSDAARSMPTRRLAFPKDMRKVIWLPNTLVDGAGDGPVPIARLRQTQRLDYLQAYIELYGLQDLEGDGGLPRDLLNQVYSRVHICDAGPFRVYGFDHGSQHCWTRGPLARFHLEGKNAPPGGWPSWNFLHTLDSLGLLEWIFYLAEGSSPDAELMHALTGDKHADITLNAATCALDGLPDWVSGRQASTDHEFILPVLRHVEAASVVGVARLTHRPHTTATGR
jgi:hypothetical protein